MEKKPKSSKKDAKPRKEKAGQKEAKKATEQKPLAGQARIISFRRGRHTQRMNQLLLEVKGVDTKAKASIYIGKRVVWTSPGKLKKQIFGKITKAHGNNGVMKARFSRGLPGTAVGNDVKISG